MSNYHRHKLDSAISVQSIITVYHLDLKNTQVTYESHDFPEIYYVEQGSSKVYVNGEEFSLDEGSMIIYGPDTLHGKEQAYIPGGIVGIISFETDAPAMSVLYNRPIRLNIRQRERFEALVAKGQSLLQTDEGGCPTQKVFIMNSVDPRETQQLKNLLELFLIELSYGEEKRSSQNYGTNHSRFYQQQMEHLTAFLLDNLDKNLTIKDMTAALWISESSLHRLVQKYKSCGPIAYFQELRMREAKNLIQTTDLSMTEVAEQLGFSSLHYFSRTFRNKTGETPTDYAKMVRKQ